LNVVAIFKENMQVQQSDTGRLPIVLGLLEAIGHDGEQTQRNLAGRFGVALGLVNTQLRICIKMGYVEVQALSGRRYVYKLTQRGVAERSRLARLSMSKALEVFQHARTAYLEACDKAVCSGWRHMVLIGASELAEVSAICALETNIKIVAVVDAACPVKRFAGAPVVATLADVAAPFDGAVITDVREPETSYAGASTLLGPQNVIVPDFLGVVSGHERAAQSPL
jgi:DNA-binding MarR family transcriptional regulator